MKVFKTILKNMPVRVAGRPLHANKQTGQWWVWHFADPPPGATLIEFEVTICPTGGEIPHIIDEEPWEYLNTFMEAGGALAWHAFFRPVP